MGKKEVNVVLHLPKNEYAVRQFEKKICDFYVAQVEQKLASFPKKKKIEVINAILANYSEQTQLPSALNKPALVHKQAY